MLKRLQYLSVVLGLAGVTGAISTADAAPPEPQKVRTAARPATPRVVTAPIQRSVSRPVAQQRRFVPPQRTQVQRSTSPKSVVVKRTPTVKIVQQPKIIPNRIVERKIERKTDAPRNVARTVPIAQPVNSANNKPRTSTGTGKALAVGAIAAGASAAVASKLGSPPQKQVFQSKLTAPFKSKYVQPGLKLQPIGMVKPTKLKHNPYYVAGLKGLKTGYKPYWFKHNGYRWYRSYYPLLAGGAWYWYWYNYAEDEAPVPISTYIEAESFECDPDDDDCGETL
jgi:hypothetical protein